MSILSNLSPNPHILHRETHQKEPLHQLWSSRAGPVRPISNGFGFDRSKNINESKQRENRGIRAYGSWPEFSKPDTLEMEPIKDCEHFDLILEKAKELSQPIVVDWMASWCRKCIYLKPKLEKLAADSKLKFYCVDVNNVPQALVKRANISKMPTIQLWKDGEMKAEVIGGHKAWLVVEEVKAMIEQFV